ncbi:MAG: TraI domain-containing protein [Pseudomonadota bacterium]|nr:TraI domain-containing protein [Pseudomonadota bacterium]
MFSPEANPLNYQETLSEAHVYPAHEANKLLKPQGVARILAKLRHLITIDEALYVSCYQQLNQRFAEFVQCLPPPGEKHHQYSMLAVSLRRAYLLVEAFSKHMAVSYGKRHAETDEGARLLYAVYAAALLFEIGNITSGRRIVLCNDQGAYLSQWLPFEKSINTYSRHFKIRYGQSLPDVLLIPMTHVLAKQIMPETGFQWIAEQTEVLHRWFEGLNLVDAFFGAYQATCNVDELLQKDPLKVDEEPIETFKPDDTLEAEQFWAWLKEQLANKTLSDEHTAIVAGELILDIEALAQIYSQQQVRSERAVVIVKQFNALGIAKMSGQDYRYEQYFSEPPGSQGQTNSFLSRTASSAQQNKIMRQFIVLDQASTQFYISASYTGVDHGYRWSSAGTTPSSAASLDRLNQQTPGSVSSINPLKDKI